MPSLCCWHAASLPSDGSDITNIRTSWKKVKCCFTSQKYFTGVLCVMQSVQSFEEDDSSRAQVKSSVNKLQMKN